MRSTARRAVVGACMVLWAAAASAQTVRIGKDASLTFSGFISATAFGQNQNFAFETKGQQVALSALYTF